MLVFCVAVPRLRTQIIATPKVVWMFANASLSQQLCVLWTSTRSTWIAMQKTSQRQPMQKDWCLNAPLFPTKWSSIHISKVTLQPSNFPLLFQVSSALTQPCSPVFIQVLQTFIIKAVATYMQSITLTVLGYKITGNLLVNGLKMYSGK